MRIKLDSSMGWQKDFDHQVDKDGMIIIEANEDDLSNYFSANNDDDDYGFFDFINDYCID